MKYIRLKTTDPYLNLAIEEYLLTNSDDDIFMIWQNEPTVVIGKNQNAYAEVDLEYAKENIINVVRRITGGGAVYHDLGNVNYTFITSKNNAKALDYEYFTKPIIKALAALGIDARLSGRNDLETDGKKFSGNAQHATDKRILHHGTLLFDTDTDIMSRVLKTNKEKLKYHAVKSHSSRVVNLKSLLPENITVEDFISAIEKEITKSAETEAAPDNYAIKELCKRNMNERWILSDKRYLTGYTVKRQKKYAYGLVNIEMTLDKDIIENIVISGDFFGTEPIETLENKLKGMDIHKISFIDPSHYIAGMSFSDLSNLIKFPL